MQPGLCPGACRAGVCAWSRARGAGDICARCNRGRDVDTCGDCDTRAFTYGSVAHAFGDGDGDTRANADANAFSDCNCDARAYAFTYGSGGYANAKTSKHAADGDTDASTDTHAEAHCHRSGHAHPNAFGNACAPLRGRRIASYVRH